MATSRHATEKGHGLRGADLRTWARDADGSALAELAGKDNPMTAVGDIYGPLAEARSRAAVHAASQPALVGVDDFRSIPEFASRPIYSTLAYDATAQVLGDGIRFSSAIWDMTIGQVWGHTIVGMDDPEHRRYRSLLNRAFTPGSVANWGTDVIVPVVHGLIDRFEAHDAADLVSELTLLFPVYVISALLDLPAEDVADFHDWAADTIAIFFDPMRALSASGHLKSFLQPLIDGRRSAPGEDLISLLVNAELDGDRLEDDAIVAFLRLLIPAGGETTARSSASLLFALLTDPDQFAALQRDRSLLPAAIDEGLRWQPPLTNVSRLVTVDTEVTGVSLPAGAIVDACIGAANRDPERWADPDRFDIRRSRQPNLAFAWGPHTCIGQHLAKVETTVVVEALLDRLPGLRLDPDAEPRPEIRGIGFRSPSSLPVVY